MAEPRPPADPVVDIRVRWRAGRVFLALAILLTLVALVRPLAPTMPRWLQGGHALLLGLVVVGSALLSSLRGSGRPERLALYAGLVLAADAAGQWLAPALLPAWPLMVLLLGSLAVAEALPVALGFAGQATLLAAADVVRPPVRCWWSRSSCSSPRLRTPRPPVVLR